MNFSVQAKSLAILYDRFLSMNKVNQQIRARKSQYMAMKLLLDKHELDLCCYIGFTSLIDLNFEQSLSREEIIYYSFSKSSLKKILK